MQIEFLGTGAAGGTPGEGRSGRLESSVLVTGGGPPVLIDATRDVGSQLPSRSGVTAAELGAVLLTHGHRDASGGIPALRRMRPADSEQLPVLASDQAHEVLRSRYARLDHLLARSVEPHTPVVLGELVAEAVEVPHAPERRFRTYAWRIGRGDTSFVYVSDLARPTDALRKLAAGTDLLVADGATWGQRIFSHLRIDEDLPVLCGWDVGRILLTQLGRSVPEHHVLQRELRTLCPRATPAYDGLRIAVSS